MYFNFKFLGASSGIGFETAKDLSKRGAKVLMLCRDTEEKAAKAKKEIVQVRTKSAICRIASFAFQFLPGDQWGSGRVQVGPLFTEVCQGVCQANKAQGGQSPFLGQQCWCCGKCFSGIYCKANRVEKDPTFFSYALTGPQRMDLKCILGQTTLGISFSLSC